MADPARRGAADSFEREPSVSRDWLDSGEAACYHLDVAAAYPSRHRTKIVRERLGLPAAVAISYLDPIRDEHGWAFAGGSGRAGRRPDVDVAVVRVAVDLGQLLVGEIEVRQRRDVLLELSDA